jgi:hypothetical protein
MPRMKANGNFPCKKHFFYSFFFILFIHCVFFLFLSHCKSRTQLYHSLLHYKFRLLLKIHEYFDSHNERNCELTELTEDELIVLYSEMIADDGFSRQEFTRFQSLIATAGRRYGGDKYENQVRTLLLLICNCISCCSLTTISFCYSERNLECGRSQLSFNSSKRRRERAKEETRERQE